MVRIITSLLFVFVSLVGYSQSAALQPKVDERMELLGVVFRLSGAEEYINNSLSYYAKDIDEYFTPFKEHEAVNLAKRLRETNGVSYDAVMSMAINIEINNGIKFKENISEVSLDKRWGEKNAIDFLELLNKFYSETKFHDFFASHQALYSAAEKNFNHLISKIDFTWFQNFFGEQSNDTFNLVLSLTNNGNYGPNVKSKDGHKELYAIIGTIQSDSLQHPTYDERRIPVIIHEFNHSFCNQLVDSVYPQMQKKADDFFKPNAKVLSLQAYTGSRTMLYEILVRACVIKYTQASGANEERIKRLISVEKRNGFMWIEELVNSLSAYEKNRDKFPRLRDYMPEVVKLQNSLSPKKLQADFYKNCARIVSTSIKNNSKNVDPNITCIVIRFDRPMNIRYNGTSYGKQGKLYFPEIPNSIKAKWDETTKQEWIIPIKLKANTTYSISFPAQFFWAENNSPLKETYYLDFKTKGVDE